MTDIAPSSTGASAGTTTGIVAPDSLDVPADVRERFAALAAAIDGAARTTLRVRADLIIEVSESSRVIGFIEWVQPVFVVYAGPRPSASEEVAQRLVLADAVEALRLATA